MLHLFRNDFDQAASGLFCKEIIDVCAFGAGESFRRLSRKQVRSGDARKKKLPLFRSSLL